MSAVLYGCETWSLTLREDHRLKTFENWALRRIFGLETDEETGSRRLHEDAHDPYSSPNIMKISSRRKEWSGNVLIVLAGEKQGFVGKRPRAECQSKL
jgi:hypothetical protein